MCTLLSRCDPVPAGRAHDILATFVARNTLHSCLGLQFVLSSALTVFRAANEVDLAETWFRRLVDAGAVMDARLLAQVYRTFHPDVAGRLEKWAKNVHARRWKASIRRGSNSRDGGSGSKDQRRQQW
jgi:hypothetical protein